MVISAYEDLSFVADLMRNGVGRKAYLLKHSISDIAGLVRVVEAVYGGHTVLDSGIIQRMARLFCKYSGALGTELSGTEHRSGPSVHGTDTQNPIIQSLRCRGLETM